MTGQIPLLSTGNPCACPESLAAARIVKLMPLMRHPNVDAMDDPTVYFSNQSLMVIHAKALYDTAQRDGVTTFTDKRTGIEVLSLPVSSRCFESPAKCSAVTFCSCRLRDKYLQTEFVKVC